ncbi:MAG: hypothetical protein AB1489_11050 [Acidobacteriota bacterium]
MRLPAGIVLRFLMVWLLAGCFMLAPVALSSPSLASVNQIDFPTAFVPNQSNIVVFSQIEPFAFTTAFHTDTLFAFNAITGEQLSSIATGDGPTFIALHESTAGRRLAVTNTAFIGLPIPTISFIDASDPTKLSVIAQAELKRNFTLAPSQRTLTFSADGTVAFVAAVKRNGSAVLFSFQVDTGEQLSQLELPAIPFNVATTKLSGQESLVLTLAGDRPQVLVVNVEDTGRLRITTRVQLPAGAGLANENNIVTNPDGTIAYLASADAGMLFAIDLVQGRIRAQAAVGSFPAQLDLVNQQLAVVAIFDGTVSIFDSSNPDNLTRVATYRSSSRFLTTAPALSADGRRGFVATQFGHQLFVFDTATGAQLSALNLNGPPQNLQLLRTTDIDRLAIIDEFNHRTVLIEADADTPKLTGIFAPPGAVNFTLTQNILFSQDGQRAFVASPTSNELLVIDTEQGLVTQRITVGQRPERIALVEVAGRARLAVINTNSSSISLVEVFGSEARITGTVALPDISPLVLSLLVVVFSNDGSTGFVADGVNNILAFDAVTGTIEQRLAVGEKPVGLALYEQGSDRRLAIICATFDKPPTIVFVDATGPLRELARYLAPKNQLFALNNIPIFSTDGRYIYVVSSFSAELLSINAQTGRRVSRIADINAPQLTKLPSTNGDRLLAVNLANDRSFIITANAQGSLRIRTGIKLPKERFLTVGNNAVTTADRAYVTDYGSGRLFIFAPTSGTLLETVVLGGGPANIALSSDGRRLLVLEANRTASRIIIIGLP